MRSNVTIYAIQDDVVADCNDCHDAIVAPGRAVGLLWLIGAADRHADECKGKP